MKLNQIAGVINESPFTISHSLENLLALPWERWATLEDVGDASLQTNMRDDPGDYPSAMGGGPLASRKDPADLQMSISFKIAPQLVQALDREEQDSGPLAYEELFENSLTPVADEYLAGEHRGVSVTWGVQRRGDLVTYIARNPDFSQYRG